eukprot:3714592-Amphidinium_carterae.1
MLEFFMCFFGSLDRAGYERDEVHVLNVIGCEARVGRNRFAGQLPEQGLKQLTRLMELDVSMNDLTGQDL